MFSLTHFVLISLLSIHCTNPVHLCCGPGQIYTETRLLSSDRCQAENEVESSCQSYKENLPNWSYTNIANIVGDNFRCNEGSTLVAAEELFGPLESIITDEGLLRLGFQEYNSNQTMQKAYNSSDFCLMYTDLPTHSDYEKEGFGEEIESKEIREAFSVCYKDEVAEEYEEERVFTGLFYPSAIFISDIFIFITMCIYLFVKDLRKKLFGKITLGFLINVFICYTCLGISYSLDLFMAQDILLNTLPCKILGYIIQHTFVAFFFWISAMTFHIAFALTNVFSAKKNQSQLKNLLPTICFAQGCPLLVTIVTAAMDLFGPCDFILPNMGKYTCFVGSEYDLQIRFFETPEFIYFYAIIALIICVNSVLFIITGASLMLHWSQTRNMNTSQKNGTKKHIKIVFKLFIIMGIPWICELASAVVVHTYGHDQSFVVRLSLDIMNLLTGVLIFIVLVCKQQMLKGIKEKMTSNSNSSNSSYLKQYLHTPAMERTKNIMINTARK